MKKLFVVCCLCTIFILLFGCGQHKEIDLTEGTQSNNYEENQARAIEEARLIASMPGIFTNKTVIGDVEGTPIYKEELELIAARMKSFDIQNPYQEAMDRLKTYKHVENLASQYGITVSDEEMTAYIDSQRTMIETATDPEVYGFLKEYCAALKMTEAEYWTIYKPIEVRRAYLKSKVDAYMESKGIQDISNDDIEYTITDAAYQQF